MKTLPHVRAIIYEHPWMITEAGLQMIVTIFENKIEGIESAWLAANVGQPEPKPRSAYDVRDGVAIIPVMGPIIPRANLFSKISGASSFDSITSMLQDAVARADVNSIMLRSDSPGGSVIGCFECASAVYEARQTSGKPIIGLVEGMGASAMYALLAQCDAVYATEGSVVGSIGVLAKMDNNDRAEKNLGNDVLVFRSAELKAPGVGPISPNQMSAIQKRMMTFDAMFDAAVVRGRPGIDIESVSNGDAWIGSEAQQMGLIDGVTTFEKLMVEITG